MMRFILFFLLTSTSLYASNWNAITIPGARCGNGDPYVVLVQEINPKKLFVEFMGGGVCWDYHSCFNRLSFFPWLGNYPVISNYSVFTNTDPGLNIFSDHSKIYFPYCTADVHAGRHIAQYNGRTIYHYGARNMELTFKHLKERGILDFSQYEDLVVYGASAGAIASLTHGKYIEEQLENVTKKTMIVDSPGLHFGSTFWDKFSTEMTDDFDRAFSNVGLYIDLNDGLVAKKMAPVFERYQDWEMGILIALRDQIMTHAFGDILPDEHRELVLGPYGLPEIARPYPNVRFWIRDTFFHTFLITRFSAYLRSDKGENVFDFVHSIYYDYQMF